MRLFIGIDLPPGIRSTVATVSERCRRDIQRAAPRAVVRWVPPDNLHITLWFLGEVGDAAAGSLSAVLNEPFEVGAFRVALRGLGVYPATGSPRVIWMGIADGRDALIRVYGELSRRLPRVGFEPERRAYAPHLTLARVKDLRRPDTGPVRAALSRRDGAFGEFDVPAVTLFRSHLSSSGSQYESLLRVPLI